MASVVAVNVDGQHRFSKTPVDRIRLLTGLGVEGDAHLGATVQHRSRIARNPDSPNLRQVHLIHQELLDELKARGFRVGAGVMGENVTTAGIALLELCPGAILRVGSAVLEITGLRNPCKQLDNYQSGLMQAVLSTDEAGQLVRRAGVMAVVQDGGEISPGDAITLLETGNAGPLLPV